MAEETKSTSAPKAKKAKPPAIEKKPFNEFMEQHFTPALEKAFNEEGIEDMKLQFLKDKLPFAGSSEEYWQVSGSWEAGSHQFNLYFLDENIKGQKAFSCSTNGVPPSTLESFMVDERRITLGLMVMYVIQRLSSRKLLAGT